MKELLTSLGLSSDSASAVLGSITPEGALSAAITFLICLVALKVIMACFRKLFNRLHIDERVRRYSLAGIRIVLWVLLVLIVADQLGIPVTSLIALLSVFSLAVSLAVQSVLSNIAGGIVIMLNKPFKEGDYIETSSGSGEVRDITLNYTYLETFDGQRVVVPNSSLSADRIINYSTLGKRRVVIKVTASYDAPTETVRQACFSAIARTNFVLEDPAPEVWLSSYGESSIEYTVRAWCKPAQYGDVLFPLTANLRETFAEAGVEMTYNHLNVHVVEK